MSGGREINAAIPVTVLLLISVSLYGIYDNLSGEDVCFDTERGAVVLAVSPDDAGAAGQYDGHGPCG